MKINISQIAQQLGVSKTTVSFVLNGKGDKHNISKETQKRILDLVKELNYIPNFSARNLKKGRSKTIAYLVPDIANPFFAKLGRKIESLLISKGYHLIFSSTDEDDKKEESLIYSFLSRQVDGIILASANLNSPIITNLIDRKLPLVFFDREDENIRSNFITVENKHSMKNAVKKLLTSTQGKVGLLSITPDVYSLKNRIEGFRLAFTESNLEVDENLIRTVDYKNIRESTIEELSYLLKQGVDSLVFTNNLLATEGIWVINKIFPERIHELKMISFDNIDLFDYAYPRVTSLAQPHDLMSEQIVTVLLENIKDINIPKKRIKLDPVIITRD